MKQLIFSFLIVVGILLSGCTSEIDSASIDTNAPSYVKANGNSAKYIIILNEDVDLKTTFQKRNENMKGKAYGLLNKHQIASEIEDVFESAFNGFTVKMTPTQAKKMAEESSVLFVEMDGEVTIEAKPAARPDKKTNPKTTDPTDPTEPTPTDPTEPTPTEPTPTESTTTTVKSTQVTPWGIKRVGGGTTTPTATAWVIDTGIDLDHPDLNVDVTRSVSFVSGTTPDDDHSHGTHIAGTIGAIDNHFGVIGVAPGAKLVSVKVMNSSGSGSTSQVISGINYVVANGTPGDVINLSLSGSASSTLDNAVINAAAKGFKFALAAGNQSTSATTRSPSRVNGENIFTVSSMTSTDSWSSFSNYGNPPIDFCAPGSSIYSTSLNGGYTTKSGTSMATPHVAGLLLLGEIRADGFVKGDPDGNPDPIAYRK